MSNFVSGNYDLRTALIFCYHLKKTAAKSHRMLVEAYGEHALGKSLCFEWFKKFRSGNFDVRDEERGTWNVIYYELLKPGETVNIERYRQQMIDLNQALREKRPEYQKRQHKVILLHDNYDNHHIQQSRSGKRLKRSVGKYFRTRLTHQTWLRPITIPLHRWDTHFLTSTSLLTKMYENGSMIGLPQKSDSFFGVASTNCQTDGKNV